MLLQMALFHSSLWLSSIPLYKYIYHIFFIHLSVNGHLGSFHVLAIVNSAAMNTGVRVAFRIRVFSRYVPRSGIAECATILYPQRIGVISLLWFSLYKTIYGLHPMKGKSFE